jgi:hypothetical protein
VKLKRFSQIIGKDMKRYIPYALGELFLIVFGILVALYINNQNANYQYKDQIDNNFQRVYTELEENMTAARVVIEKLQEKDSMIYRVMNDSISAESYYKDKAPAYLILFYHDLNLEDKAFQNLMQLAISDNKYRNDLLNQVKELYSINENIKAVNKRIEAFVYEESLPLLARNTESFGDLTYKNQVKKDVVDFMMNSNEYKSYVSQYAIIAIKNQLRYNQTFLSMAEKVYEAIGDTYGLKAKVPESNLKKPLTDYTGSYVFEYGQYRDTLKVAYESDSLSLRWSQGTQMGLIRLNGDRFFTNTPGGGYFVTFDREEGKPEPVSLRIHLLSYRLLYQRISPTGEK